MLAPQLAGKPSAKSTSSHPSVLLITSNVVLRRRVTDALPQPPTHAANGGAMKRLLKTHAFDAVIIDQTLDDGSAHDWLVQAGQRLAELAVVVVSKSREQAVAVEAMRAGASDLLNLKQVSCAATLNARLTAALSRKRHTAKRPEQIQVEQLQDEIESLRRSNRKLLDRNQTIERLSSDLMQLNIDLSQISRVDPMTRLLNRAAFETNLAETHKQAQREGGSYAVMMVDVDHFKDFNDTMGHQAGDDCLVRVAEIIRETVRKTDCVGRYGGEEIIVLCPGIDVVSAAELAERVRAAVQGLQIVHPRSTASSFVTVTLGLAVGPDMGSWSEVIGRADERLYTAKREGRNQIAA